ncbi:hypothetical protein Poli38472_006815 [Pythium oligandrum]|uniref:Fe2OG dioxygenase domain-containing protein n=1 Tax=Pythium oligandrum TaxID=41045 RepID=A0A8K1FB18_PYTOL|nr:hypothetical protein Poli38472_006815 [Pythium oligandrum]|eukprot:TMW56805.1 hypothetical protein Poli38472_006815 [Pythium oligandrum]
MALMRMRTNAVRALRRVGSTPRASVFMKTSTQRSFSSDADYSDISVLPLFADDAVRDAIQNGLKNDGFCVLKGFAGDEVARLMREESERLYEEGYMFPSKSTDEHGREMVKPNVFATELDGHEWELAPTILDYTRSVVLQAPVVLNHMFPHLKMSQRTYGTKLAVSLGGGSKYPKHCDNSGLPDQRKVTMVYYLNPHWDESQGGELRIYTKDKGIQVVPPVADTLAMFWSDQVVHDVLPTLSDTYEKDQRRYALTLWLVSDNVTEIVNPRDPLYALRQEHFPTE